MFGRVGLVHPATRRTKVAAVELHSVAQWRMVDEGANVPRISKPSEPPRTNIARPKLSDRMLRI